MTQTPLIVDLDGTLIRSDLLYESIILYLKNKPYKLFTLLSWLFKGKAAFKERLAKEISINVSTLPYNDLVLKHIHESRRAGCRIILATASHKILASQVSEHLKLFDDVLSSSQDINLAGINKRDALLRLFGEGNFDYIGNSHDDLPVWQVSRNAIVVNAPNNLFNKVQKISKNAIKLEWTNNTLHTWMQAFRIHQWSKNLLVFIPLFASHRYTEGSSLLESTISFVCFCLCASSIYLLNDFIDLDNDRNHYHKRNRPFAAGNLSVRMGMFAACWLFATGIGLGLMTLSTNFSLALFTYCALSIAYSLLLKSMIIVDVIILASLYTLRIIAGTFSLNLSLSFWLLIFSIFFFFSLALLKRYTEIFNTIKNTDNKLINGRGYQTGDKDIISSLGVSSGFTALLVLMLYLHDPLISQFYVNPKILWLTCPIFLFWLSRLWILAHRGKLNEDPVLFALRDLPSISLITLIGVLFWLSL